MKFTLLLLAPPLFVLALAAVVGLAGSTPVAGILAAVAVLWLWVDLYAVPLYWAVRIARHAWGWRETSASDRRQPLRPAPPTVPREIE